MKNLLLLVFFFAICNNAFSQIYISENTVWDTDQFLSQTTIIEEGVTLTIEEGVVIQVFYIDVNDDSIGDVELIVNGELVINGSPCNLVSFEPYIAETHSDWAGIRFNSSETNANLSYFEVNNAHNGLLLESDVQVTWANLDSCNVGIAAIGCTSIIEKVSVSNSLASSISTMNSTIQLSNSSLTNNGTYGILNQNESLCIAESIIITNSNLSGVLNNNSTFQLSNGVISENGVFGLVNNQGDFEINYTDVNQNLFGGVYLGNGSSSTINYSTFEQNHGASIEISEWSLSIDNDDFLHFNNGSAPNEVVINECNLIDNTVYNTQFVVKDVVFNKPSCSQSGYISSGSFSTPFLGLNGIMYKSNNICCSGSSGKVNFYDPDNVLLGSVCNVPWIADYCWQANVSQDDCTQRSTGLVKNEYYDSFQLSAREVDLCYSQSNNVYANCSGYDMGAAQMSFTEDITSYELGGEAVSSSVNINSNYDLQYNFWGGLPLINDINGENFNYSGLVMSEKSDSHSTITDSTYRAVGLNTNTGLYALCSSNDEITLFAPDTDLETISYTWYYYDVDINHNLPQLDVTSLGFYSVVITDISNDCELVSEVVEISIAGFPPNTSIYTIEEPIGCVGDEFVLYADSTVNTSYQWYNNDVEIESPNDEVFLAQANGVYSLTILDNDSGCQSESNEITVSILDYPEVSISTNGIPVICGDNSVTLVSELSSGSIETYLWYLNGSEIPSANESTLLSTEGGEYTLLVQNENDCSNSSNAIVVQDNNSNTYESIASCDDYYWNGTSYTASGVYNFIGTNDLGCTNNAFLEIEIIPTSYSVDTRVSCDSLVWIDNEVYFSNNNSATHILTNSFGCDSVVTLDLEINNSSTSNISNIECGEYYWPITGQYYSASGMYSFDSINSDGCLHTNVLDLIVSQTTYIDDEQIACDSLTWINGTTYYEAADAEVILSNFYGCDSIVNLNLTVNSSTVSTLNHVECAQYFWDISNEWYATSGAFEFVGVNSNGCQHVDSLVLTIIEPYEDYQQLEICPGEFIEVGAIQYFNSGDYSDTLSNYLGCDSIINTNLNVLSSSLLEQEFEICPGESVEVNGSIITTEGMFVDTLSNYLGCDSVITTNVVLFDLLNLGEIYGPVLVTDYESSYFVSGADGSTYEWSVQFGEIVNGQAGNSIDVVWDITQGATIISVTEIFENGCIGETITIVITLDIIDSINEISLSHKITIKPNPFYDKALATFSNLENQLCELRLYSSVGTVVRVYRTNADSQVIEKSGLASGVYYLYISNPTSRGGVKFIIE